ncbi:RNA polymerase sigma factor FliA [Halorhodospira halochloris]|uniref:RNA polymerase sigma factor FliA n=1 Tax=Halorhodospira halochloris TaxID=1052 RepID=A0A0X8XBT7_HALHR|nr:RNA polymerase sigma factor FliA [Halorhodospira halochloris]MBK1651833.1 RNA polymerase sigma factor FliA [Halorhodospira halochloris]MCG5529978.1 RNA polymerase sigma factor FliA [Halorhodospira halochloris]MCG5548251.1 RNA polymerase sigma factor FliA [Halorhodospira halochloris]BAU58832.1 RNA polymerase sigma factor for flagellar operon [Halorhodospira halochloris]
MNGHAMYTAVASQGDEDLVTRHASLVKRIAHHLASRLPASVQLEDLIQAGMIGLLEAARQYDSSQGASFQTYAGIRIRGAMLDEIRRLDWTPRSVHRKGRDVAEAVRQIEHRTGRDARDHEVAEAMGISIAEYHSILQDVSTARVFSIDQEDPNTGEVHEPQGSDPGPLVILQDDAFQAELAEAIRELPERERLVMALYYDEELNLREIGEVLEVSESRVSQIHGRIMLKLRNRLADWTRENQQRTA